MAAKQSLITARAGYESARVEMGADYDGSPKSAVTPSVAVSDIAHQS